MHFVRAVNGNQSNRYHRYRIYCCPINLYYRAYYFFSLTHYIQCNHAESNLYSDIEYIITCMMIFISK